jgi:hypothetical protein
MGVFASLLEFASPQRLAAADARNLVVLHRLLLAIFDLARPDLGSPHARRRSHKNVNAGSLPDASHDDAAHSTAAHAPFAHPLTFCSAHLRADAFDAADTRRRHPQLLVRHRPADAVLSARVDSRGRRAYAAEARRSPHDRVVRVFVAVADLHHLGVHLWHVDRAHQVDELRVIVEANPQFMCLISGVMASATDVLHVAFLNVATRVCLRKWVEVSKAIVSTRHLAFVGLLCSFHRLGLILCLRSCFYFLPAERGR